MPCLPPVCIAHNDVLERNGAQAVRDNTPVAMLMTDIDYFKTVNDRYRHVAGNHVLRELVRRVANRLRRADMLDRFGGEKLLAQLPATGVQGAMVVAQGRNRVIAQ